MLYPSLTYTNPDGDELNFRELGVDIGAMLEGLSNPEPTFHFSKTPYTHGSTLISGVAGERIISVPIFVKPLQGISMQAALLRINDVLNPWIRKPLDVTEGMLRFQSCEDDPVYEIPAVPMGTKTKDEMPSWSGRVVDFLCPYPFFRRVPDTIAEVSIAAAGFEIPWSVPTNILTQSGTLNVYIFGNIPTSPRIEVTGPASDIWITHQQSGAVMRVFLTLGALDTLVIDGNTKTLTVGETNAAGFVQSGSTFIEFQRGANTLDIAVDSGSPTIKVTASHYFSGVR